MNILQAGKGAAVNAPASRIGGNFVVGEVSGMWQSRDHGATVSWQLQCDPSPAYQVKVSYCGQDVVEVWLDGQSSQKTLFDVRDPDAVRNPVSGAIFVQRRNDTGASTKLDLVFELTNDTKQPSATQRLASCLVADIVRQRIPGNEPKAVPVADLSESPYCFVGKLKMRFKNKSTKKYEDYIGTATVIEAPFGQTGLYLLTCAHNLYDAVDGEATQVSFILGMNDQNPQPLELEAETLHYPSNYVGVATTHHADRARLAREMLEVNANYDYGLVKLKVACDVTSTPPLAPYVASDDQLRTIKEVALSGLYGWNDQNNTMFAGTGSLDGWNANLLAYGVSTDEGCSGTAVTWQHQNVLRVIGVHDGGGAPENYNIGHRITQDTLDQLNAWMGEGA